MRKHNSLLFFVIWGASVLLAAGCVKEADVNEQYRPEGSPIVFGVGISYDTGSATRTEFSGHLYGDGITGSTSAVERIDWVAGDPVTIYYKHPDGNYSEHPAHYTVTNDVSANAEKSDAAIQVASGSTALTWASSSGNGEHVFTAVYPREGFNGNNYAKFNGVEVKAFIPGNQNLHVSNGRYLPDMKYASMVAYKAIPTTSTESTVVLPFKPAFTAIEFRLRKSGSAPALTVTSVTLSSSTGDLAGGFSFDITGGNDRGATWGTVGNSWNGDRFRDITVSFGAGVTLSETADLDFTLLALPVNMTNVSLTISYSNGTSSTVAFKEAGTNQAFTFQACKKYIISNYLSSSWEYVIDEVDDIVTYGHAAASLNVGGIRSYRRGPNDEIEAVSWKTQYWNGTDWQDWSAATSGFSLNTYAQGSGVSNLSSSESRTVSLVANSTYAVPTQTSAQILAARTPVSNYDLSAHDIYGNEYPGGKHTTANTYVVSAPGTYLIPCVYGNAITNDRVNFESFAPGGADSSIKSIYSTYVSTYYAMTSGIPLYQFPDVNYTPFFRNAINTNIASPYIFDDINGNAGFSISGENAVVVWQDAQIVNTQPTVVTIDGRKYVRFAIGANEIKPGNVVIALRGNPGGSLGLTESNPILWSWQIWVTDQDLHPIGSVMPANLGWHASELGNQKYTDRSLPIRLVQIVPNDDPHANVAHADFTVTQIGDSQNVGENIGSCTYYQWGRKDPMIPGVYSTSPRNFIGQPCTDKAIYPTSDYSGMNFYTTNVAVTSSNPDANYGTAIRNPDKAYAGEGTTTSWIEGYFPGWTYVSDGHGGTGAGFSGRRSETAIPYNLWDAYCYGDNSDADGTHKVKTVYDPCPPGFAVPYKNIASSLGTPSAGNGGRYFTQSNGVTQFFPYSGARVYFNVDPSTAPNYVAITPGLYINEVADAGLYWTDCPYNIKTNSSYNASSNWAGPGAYTDHYYSHILTISASSASLTYSTKGTAGIVRPMVYNDPNY